MSSADRVPEAETRRPGRPRDARTDAVILETAREMLMEVGYSGLTIDGVAARAGVGRPTIYRRWASKAALVVAALVGSSRLALPAIDTGSLHDDLVAVLRHQVDLMTGSAARRVTAGLIADLATDSALSESYVNDYLAPRRAIVWEVLQRAVDRGELGRDADFAFIYDLLVGPLFMRAVIWGEAPAEDAAEQIAAVVVTAFAPQ